MVGHHHITVDDDLVPLLSNGEALYEYRVDPARQVGVEEKLSLKAAVAYEIDALLRLAPSFSSHRFPLCWLLVARA